MKIAELESRYPLRRKAFQAILSLEKMHKHLQIQLFLINEVLLRVKNSA